jgi:hypothetical protein
MKIKEYMNKESLKSYKSKVSDDKKIRMFEDLVEELMKDSPDQQYVRRLCVDLKIPYSLNASTQIGNVFNKLQTLKAQAITR